MAVLLRPRWADDPTVHLPCQEPDADPDIFHPIHYDAAPVFLAFCGRCPKQPDCLEFGLASKESGVWGGRNLSAMSVRAKNDLLVKVQRERGAV